MEEGTYTFSNPRQLNVGELVRVRLDLFFPETTADRAVVTALASYKNKIGMIVRIKKKTAHILFEDGRHSLYIYLIERVT